MINAIDLRKGNLVNIDGNICSVVFWNLWKSDRRSRVQLRLKDIRNGRVSEVTAQSDDKYNVVPSEMIDLSHSYKDGDEEVFYTPDGVEYRCSAAAVADVLAWQQDAYKGLLVDGQLFNVELPLFVVATVADTTPPIKGVLNGLKDAKLDNGLTVKVGMVVAVGDRVRINTETMEYKDRV